MTLNNNGHILPMQRRLRDLHRQPQKGQLLHLVASWFGQGFGAPGSQLCFISSVSSTLYVVRYLFTQFKVREVDRRSASASAASASASSAISHLASFFLQQHHSVVHHRLVLSLCQVVYESSSRCTASQIITAPWGELPDVEGSTSRQFAARRTSG
jgi:hypothetical protein